MQLQSNPVLMRFSGVPSLLAEEAVDQFTHCMFLAAADPNLPKLMSAQRMDDDFWPEDEDDWMAYYRPYVVQNGILLIPVQGSLLDQFPYAAGWATGYQYIGRALDRGMADPNVQGVAFMVNSPGGTVAENYDLIDKIVSYRGTKPMQAFVAENAFSAAYNIVAATDSINVTRTGATGSIGVITMHVDYSGAMDKAGIKVTFISAPEGGDKAAGNPYEPLSSDTKDRIQARINETYEMFVEYVATNRAGKIDAQGVRDTKAQTFSASQSISNGLADTIGSTDDAMAVFAADLSKQKGVTFMSTQDNSVVDQAAAQAALDAARAEGMKAGADAAKARMSAILGLESAKDRETLARHIAMNTDLSAEAADEMLKVSPKEASAQGEDNTFNDAMRATGKPAIGASGDQQGQQDDPDAAMKSRIDSAMAAAGRVRKSA